MKMTVTLNSKEVEDIVKAHLETKFGSVGGIKFEVGKKQIGNQMHDHYVETFKGASCEVEVK